MTELVIRPARPDDRTAIWALLEPVIRAGETYALPRDLAEADALAYWFAPGHAVFVAEGGGVLAGTYFLQANNRGGGAHVANCGYVARPGQGAGRAMGAHSLREAASRGFRAMQFNFVVASNSRAVRLWRQLGFAVAGVLPGAFLHPTLGEGDALVMHRRL